MWFDKGDRVRTNANFIAANGYGVAGLVVEIVNPDQHGTLSSWGSPCKRTHRVKLDDPFLGKWDYLTFCPEDLERA